MTEYDWNLRFHFASQLKLTKSNNNCLHKRAQSAQFLNTQKAVTSSEYQPVALNKHWPPWLPCNCLNWLPTAGEYIFHQHIFTRGKSLDLHCITRFTVSQNKCNAFSDNVQKFYKSTKQRFLSRCRTATLS